MSNNDFLWGIISKQELSLAQKNALTTQKEQIEVALRSVYGWGPKIYYAGSFGKGTMISAAFDLDIVIYFPSTETTSVKDIYKHVGQTLKNKGYVVKEKNVALRLPYDKGYHIDVVPGRAQDETYYHATLYKNEDNTTMQTSIKKHIDSVQPVKNTIKLMKLWRVRQGVSWETFALEQTVIRALIGKDKDNMERNLLNVFVFIRDNIATVSLIDPANSNNKIEIPYSVKTELKKEAIKAFDASLWSDVLW